MSSKKFRPIILAGGSGKRLWPLSEVLEIIEIQTGTYFGEDDIVRFEDIYGRKNFH